MGRSPWRLRIVVSKPRVWKTARRAGIVALWIGGGGGLIGLAFGFSFYFAMMAELKSTEVSVPDLTGLNLEAATNEVEPLELVLLVVDQRHDPTVPSDRVLQQVPSPGSSVRRGRKVKLILSLGGKVLEVPNFVGKAARAVEIELRQQGFTPGFEVEVPALAAVGTVLSQVPPAATPALPDSRVHRLISAGPARTVWVTPNLIGMPRLAAERWIQRSGFRVTVRRVRISGLPPGTVVGQLPLPGYPIRANEIMEITLAE